jgi:secreted trypsin-like serine protease
LATNGGPLGSVRVIASALAALACASGCLGSSSPDPERTGAEAEAVTGGEPDARDPSVVALVSGGAAFCSGTLVAPRVVLTAAHCVGFSLADLRIAFGSDPQAAESLAVVASHVHPDFDPVAHSDDIALLLLEAAAPPEASPLPLMTERLDGFVGAPLRFVGFGMTDASDAGARTKHDGTSVISAVQARSFSFSAGPSHPCGGDSGGPAFVTVAGREIVAGLTAAGDPGCAGGAIDTRVDPYVADFIRPYLDATAAGAAPPRAGGCALGVGASKAVESATLALAVAMAMTRRRRRDAGETVARVIDPSMAN